MNEGPESKQRRNRGAGPDRAPPRARSGSSAAGNGGRARAGAFKAALVALEIIGVLVAVAAGAAGFLAWRLQQGPVSLGVFRPSAEFAVERSLPPGYGATVSEARLERGAGKGDAVLHLAGVRLDRPDGGMVANLSEVRVGFAWGDVLRGAPGPRDIEIAGAALHVERRADGAWSLDFPQAAGERDLLRVLTGGRYFRGAFRSATLEDAEVRFRDAASGRTWRASPAEARIVRTAEGYAASLDGAFDIGGDAASLSLSADFDAASEGLFVSARFADAPVGDLLETFFGAGAALLTSPLTGEAALTLSGERKILRSRIEARAGAGELLVAGRALPVETLDFAATFDPAADAFDLEALVFDIAGSRGRFSGAVSVAFDGARRPSDVRFDVEGADISIAAEVFPEPLPVERLALSGHYDVAGRRLILDDFAAGLLGVVASGEAEYAPARGSPEIRARGKIDGALAPEQILRAWPRTFGLGARDFVEGRLPRATVENIAFAVDLPAGALEPDAPFPDDALAVTFDIKNATTIYTPGMTPFSNASGRARLSGNRFVISAIRGRVGDVPITEGDIDFTALSPRGAPVKFRFTAAGAARDMLGVLNEEPLSLLESTGLEPGRFVGEATARVEITRPNLREASPDDYGYSGSARFEDLTVLEFYEGADLAGAAGAIELETRRMKLVAEAKLGGAPIDFEWTQPFRRADGPALFLVRGEMNSAAGDFFGVPTRQYLRGTVPFEIEAAGAINALERVRLSADFTDAELTADAFGWRKPQGEPTVGALSLTRGEEGVVIDTASIEGESIEIRGGASLGPEGAISALALDRFHLRGAADFSLSAARADSGVLDIALTGPFLDAAGLIETLVEAQGGDGGERLGEGVDLRARLDELHLRRGAVYQDASLDFRRDFEGRILGFDFSARTANGAPLSVVLSPTGAESGPAQRVEARTDDIGALLEGVFGVASIRGGEGSLEIDVHSRMEDAAGGLSGVMHARNMQLVEAPLLARVFAAGSLDGLANLLSGEGIALHRAFARFDFDKGVLTLKEARASGPSVGITSAGAIAAGDGGAVNLSGAIAPAYQVNSLLGRAPVIGDLFVNREGEGVLALSWSAAGAVDSPAVTVNPLSALTPGFLRRMFEIDRTGAAGVVGAPE